MLPKTLQSPYYDDNGTAGPCSCFPNMDFKSASKKKCCKKYKKGKKQCKRCPKELSF